MDVVANIRTFLAVARLGSFSAAARETGTVPSVIAKRISQLEHRLQARLLDRSTRGLALTGAGQEYQRRFLALLSDLDAALGGGPASHTQEHIRIKCPTTVSGLEMAEVFVRFRVQNPQVRIELVLVDRPVNPLEEGFDIAIGALPASYPHVEDVPLCPLPRRILAAPSYLARRGTPRHPRDLVAHDCITFPLSGTRWVFDGPSGEVAVEVDSVFSATDSRVLLTAVEAGAGIAVIAEHVARPALTAGTAVAVLPDYRVPDLYVKALVPEGRRSSPTVQAMLAALVAATRPLAPWDRAAAE